MTNDLPEIFWHLENGGHGGRLAGHALRLLNEAVELCVAAGATSDEVYDRVKDELNKVYDRGVTDPGLLGRRFKHGPEELAEEIADVQILLNVLAHHAGHANTRPLVDAKLDVLRQRKWEVDGDGVLWRPKT